MAPVPRLRDYGGPAVLSYGFRPLFLLASLQAGLWILLWLGVVSGRIDIPTTFSPADWHVHEMLFGFQAAAIGGFLLTAIPNWTGRLPVQGMPLLALVLAWLAGRLAISTSSIVGWQTAMAVDSLFLLLLAGAAAREIIAGSNWRNLKVVGILGVLLATNIGFHLEVHFWGGAWFTRRLAIGAALMLLTLIAGRIVPSFTRNWLVQQRSGRLPVAFGTFDKTTLMITAPTLVLWVTVPTGLPTGTALGLCALLHGMRLARWVGWRCWRNPLLIILHVGYLFVPIGFALLSAASLDALPVGAGIHAWTAGAFGIMTIAVMSRASLGHTGRALVATPVTQLSYGLVTLGAVSRIAYAIAPEAPSLLQMAGLMWSLGFLIFVIGYWRVFTGKSVDRKRPTGARPG